MSNRSPRNNGLHVDNDELNGSDAFSQISVNQSSPRTPNTSRPCRNSRNRTATLNTNWSSNIIIDLTEVETPPRSSNSATNRSVNNSDVILVEENEVIDLCTPTSAVCRQSFVYPNMEMEHIEQNVKMWLPHIKCPICLADIDQATATKCGHVSCQPCIYKALSISRKCPMCNVKTFKKDLRRIYI